MAASARPTAPERARSGRSEDEAGATLGIFVSIDDGIGEAAAGSHDRWRGVAHGDELTLAAGLECEGMRNRSEPA